VGFVASFFFNVFFTRLFLAEIYLNLSLSDYFFFLVITDVFSH
jgi:hypothetical protein